MMTYFVMTCARTGETMEHYACERHAERIVVDGDSVRAYDCDEDVTCDECEAVAEARRKRAEFYKGDK
jgi:hypothetical protein|tara:strand:- start:625 stop:828 length:204 start_codon:yes stop_codon:yes gene_type:complete